MAHDTAAPLSNAQMRDIVAPLHPYTNAVTHRKLGANLIDRDEGVSVYDEQGRKFIEGLAGLWRCVRRFGD